MAGKPLAPSRNEPIWPAKRFSIKRSISFEVEPFDERNDTHLRPLLLNGILQHLFEINEYRIPPIERI